MIYEVNRDLIQFLAKSLPLIFGRYKNINPGAAQPERYFVGTSKQEMDAYLSKLIWEPYVDVWGNTHVFIGG